MIDLYTSILHMTRNSGNHNMNVFLHYKYKSNYINMRWHFVLILSTLWHYAMADCPAGQYVEQTCITSISYQCAFDPNVRTHCYEDEITFTIKNAAGDSIYSSGQQTQNTWSTKNDTTTNLCSTEFTIELADSYGDGWNGAYLMFFSGGNLLQVSSGENTEDEATIDTGTSKLGQLVQNAQIVPQEVTSQLQGHLRALCVK